MLTVSEKIGHAQAFPFLAGNTLANMRELPIEKFKKGYNLCPEADLILFQTWFDLSNQDMIDLARRIHATWPRAKVGYLDWFAPADLRYADALTPHVDLYVKKQIFADRSQYSVSTIGDSNLTDYYARTYGLNLPWTYFHVPAGFWDKFHLGPGFESSAEITSLSAKVPDFGSRNIDLHARIAVNGTEWYRAMRMAAFEAADRLRPKLNVAMTGRVSQRKFYAELRQAKLCFSPFGYGEICWRDYEAMATGAVLLKPDVGHLRMATDLFQPGRTYVPVRWDLSDLPEKVMWLLSSESERRRIAQTAYTALIKANSRTAMLRQVQAILGSASAGAF